MIFEIMFRVIILKIDIQTCRERLLNRGLDLITENKCDLSSCESSMTNPDCKLNVHSDDHKDIEQDVTIVLYLHIYIYIDSRFI